MAVGLGLGAAARLSHRMGLCTVEIPKLVEEKVAAIGLPNRTDGMDGEELYAAMMTDKKWRSGRSQFVLLRDIGQPELVWDVPQADVVAVLNELR